MPRKTNKNKYIRRHKQKKTITRKRRGGACGCNAQRPAYGGSAHLTDVPQYAYYPYNSNLINDQTDPANINTARFMGDYSRMSGGGKRRREKGRKRGRKSRKTRGGSNFFSNLYTQLANSGSGMNYINSFGAVNGSTNQSALVTGTNGLVNSSSTSHPVLSQPYGFPNPPLA